MIKIYIFGLFFITIITQATAFVTPFSQCEFDSCGPNSKCVDDQKDPIFIELKEPYCLCEPNTIGSPPNCTLGCAGDENCEDDEYCDLDSKTCAKICDTPNCGDNSYCNGIDHNMYCSCQPGYYPIKGKGCINDENGYHQNLVEGSMDEMICHDYCGAYASCLIDDAGVHCYCPRGIISNPIVECPPPLLFVATPETEYCECCEQAIDPFCAIPLSCILDANCLANKRK